MGSNVQKDVLAKSVVVGLGFLKKSRELRGVSEPELGGTRTRKLSVLA